MTDAEHAAKVLSLDEKRESERIKFAAGKWGAGWILEQLAEIFDEIVVGLDDGTEHYHGLHTGMAVTRAKMLRALAREVFGS